MAHGDGPYLLGGNKNLSQMSEPSSANRGGGTTQMRILVELMIMNMILKQAFEISDSIEELRQDCSDSIT